MMWHYCSKCENASSSMATHLAPIYSPSLVSGCYEYDPRIIDQYMSIDTTCIFIFFFKEIFFCCRMNSFYTFELGIPVLAPNPLLFTRDTHWVRLFFHFPDQICPKSKLATLILGYSHRISSLLFFHFNCTLCKLKINIYDILALHRITLNTINQILKWHILTEKNQSKPWPERSWDSYSSILVAISMSWIYIY